MSLRTLRSITKVTLAGAVALTALSAVTATPAYGAQAANCNPTSAHTCYSGDIPSNAFGRWIKMRVNSPFSGTNSCSLWDDDTGAKVAELAVSVNQGYDEEVIYGLYGQHYFMFCFNNSYPSVGGTIYNA